MKTAEQRLFDALRLLEIQFLNDGSSVKIGLIDLLKGNDVPTANYVAKYLYNNNIVKQDPNKPGKESFIYWNGPRLSLDYCMSILNAVRTAKNDERKAPTIDIKNEIKQLEDQMSKLIDEYDKKRIIVDYLKSKL